MKTIQVALPIPKRQVFDYLTDNVQPKAGCRVLVPFGPRSLVGVVVSQKSASYAISKLKPVSRYLDDTPVLCDRQIALCEWMSRYYQHPLGDVFHTVLPALLRKGKDASVQPITYLEVTDKGVDSDATSLGRAVKQQQLLTLLQNGAVPLSSVRELFTESVIKGLIEKDLVKRSECVPKPDLAWHQSFQVAGKPEANVEQALAVSAITRDTTHFQTHLLEGVTGSGKTEVYLQCIEPVIKAGRQVLILVPEIGLTPQTVERFKRRFSVPVGVLHSGLTDNERLLVWKQSRRGEAAIIIGTRSAVFTPLKKPGMIIVDEEHDGSYKQQDGLRYHARDVAAVRAQMEQVPLILGTATPSLETLNNALNGKYLHHLLRERAGNASHTVQRVLDIRNQPLNTGLAPAMIDKVRQHLSAGNQVMLFINRRGYSPALLCHSCGHVENCHRCDKPFTLHRSIDQLQCHHCGATRRVPSHCQQCGSDDIEPFGVGTEQLEEGLTRLFPDTPSVRIDSDSARGKARLQQLLDDVHNRKHQLLIGTQILSKGHHFPHVTLVVVMDVDGALFSADYRAAENLAQLITQLAGRAGRAEKSGEMWLQTYNPGHPLLQDLVNNGYGHFARFALQERKLASLPPHTYQALLRAEATNPRHPEAFLRDARQIFAGFTSLFALGPIPALMEKKQGRHRMQLLIQSSHRSGLQQALAQVIDQIEALPSARSVRWSLDVDPQDFM